MKKTIYICGMIILIALILFILPLWNVQAIQVVGNEKYTQQEIEDAIDYTKGKHILSYNQKEMEKQLLELPYIKQVEIQRTFPNHMSIQVVERTPVGYVPFLDSLLCIDEDGYVLKQVKSKQEELPIVEGIQFESFSVGQVLPLQQPQQIQVLEEIMFYLKKRNFVEEIDVIELTNIEQIHLYVNRLNVIIGNMRDFDKKVRWLVDIHEDYPMGILDLSMMEYDQVVLKPLN